MGTHPVRLRAVPYEVPFRRPLRTAHGTLRVRTGFWVVAEDDAGRIGLGEVAPLPDWGTETTAEAAAALAACADFAWAPEIAPLDTYLSAAGLERGRFPATAAGVELACLDLLARQRNVSLAALLASEGPAPSEAVPINALLSADEPEALAAEARLRVAEGYRTLKLKVGAGAIADDARRVRAVREAVGPEIRLRADANGAWDPAAALTALAALRPFDLEYLEQPVPDARDLAPLRDRGLVPIAADESAQDPRAARALIAERTVDWIVLKPMAIGGLLRARELALAARAAGLGVTMTSVLDRGVGIAGALHLAASLGLSTACGLSTTHLADHHVVGPRTSGSRTAAGMLPVLAPGHGVVLPDALLAPAARA
jgi:o-succinylbenzoate synthase